MSEPVSLEVLKLGVREIAEVFMAKTKQYVTEAAVEVVCSSCGKEIHVDVKFQKNKQWQVWEDFMQSDRSKDHCDVCGTPIVQEISFDLIDQGILHP